MKVLITGGLGFIGVNICRKVLESGWDAILFDSLVAHSSKQNYFALPTLKESGKVEFIHDDIKNINKHQNARPDVIIHLAANLDQKSALKTPKIFLDVNVMGTQEVLEFSRQRGGVPILFASSCKVYSTWINTFEVEDAGKRYRWKKRKGITEKDPLDVGGNPHGIYGLSKLLGENICQEYAALWGVPIIINRMSSIFGWQQYGTQAYGWLWHFIESKKRQRPITIYGNGKQVRDVLFIDDLCALYMKQIMNLAYGIRGANVFTVGGGRKNSISILETVDILDKLAEKPLRVIFREERLADFKVYISDIGKVASTYDWTPLVSPQEGIERLFNG